MSKLRAPILVLGLGNKLLTDDGFGLELLEGLRQSHGHHAEVAFVDGGTQGLGLLSEMEDRRALLILDAVGGGTPGAVQRLDNPQNRPAASGIGAHGANASGLLGAALLLDDLPEHVVLVGATPSSLRTHIGLSESLQAALPAATQLARESLEELVLRVSGGETCMS